MQIKKEDTMESVDVSAEQSRFSKKSRNKHEQRIKLHVANAERQQCGGSGRHLSTSRPDQLHTNGPTENQKLLGSHLHKDLYHRDRGP